MAALKPLTPTIKIRLDDSYEFILIEAGRTERGLQANVQLINGGVKVADVIVLGSAKARATQFSYFDVPSVLETKSATSSCSFFLDPFSMYIICPAG